MVSIIIINYDTFDITCNCIESIINYTKGTPYEIVVVDNASPTDDPNQFLERFPDIVLVKSTENGGFAKGNNLGIQHARGDKILLLNSDTWLTEDSITIAANALEKFNKIGPLTVRLVYPDGRIQHTARAFRSIRNELLDLFRPLLYLLPYRYRAKLMFNQYFKNDFSTYCDWISGAFMLFRKEVLNHLPGKKLDERFFMYGEDQLWCYQFTQLGYPSYFLVDTTVVHIANASTLPSKRKKLLNVRIAREKEIMRYRKGKSAYYYIFSLIYTSKAYLANFLITAMQKLKKG